MCGIVGVNYKVDRSIAQQRIKTMLSLQHHRGPDYNDVYSDEKVVLGHNRLSLIDLSSNGHQPFQDNEFVLIYNGEIYNFEDIRKELPPRQYISRSDTEVLFWALKSWGVERTLEKIEGMFAFAWYGKVDGRLYLVRDRLGIKPLFYGTCKEGNIVFASELKTLVSEFDFQLDIAKIAYSALGILEKSRDYTAWHNLFHVPPGAFIKIEERSIEVKPYFSLVDWVDQSEYERLDNCSKNEVVEELSHLLNESVKSMLVSDAPMGAFVSGGVDSSLIANMALNHDSDLQLFTANVIGKYSEYKDAQELAKTLAVPLHAYSFKKEFALRDITKVTWHYESPLITHFNAIAFSNVAGLANEQKVKAVLTGEGADELFLGYPKLLTRKYSNFINAPFNIFNKLYSYIPSLKSYTNKAQRSEGLTHIMEMSVQNYTRQYLREDGMQAYSFIDDKDIRFDHYLTAQMLQEGIVSLLWRNDRMGMINSIESRFPFLNEKVVAFALNLPIKFKIGRISKFYNYKHPFLIDKMVVREMARKTLPDNLVYKKKFGFATHDLRDLKVNQAFFNDGIVQEIFRMNQRGFKTMVNKTSGYHMGLLAALELWAGLFVRKQPVDIMNEKVQQCFSYS